MNWGRILLVSVAAGVLGVVVTGLWDVHAAFQGWLVAFLLAGLAPLGALALLLIGELTGARWTGPLVPIAATVPVLCLFALPVLAGYPLIYPWHAGGLDPNSGQPIWLAPVFFVLRSVLILAGWSTLALLAVRGRLTPLLAGLGLLAHGLFVSVAAYDWLLSIQPGWVNTSMGMNLATQQIGAACAVVGLLGLENDREAPAFGGLLAAALLGVVYLELMDYIIVWYGNLPEKASWYVVREQGLWWVLVPVAAVIGLVVPLAVLGFGGAWKNKLALASGLGLAGLALYDVWMAAPAFGAKVLPGAFFACVVQFVLLGWCAVRVSRAAKEDCR